MLAAGLIGCATPTIYHWGNFESGLYDRYVNEDHAQADVYLFETVHAAEQRNLRVPPGAYADYGFLLFQRGDYEGAKAYFEKERQLFPESSALMTQLIERIEKKAVGTTKANQSQAMPR